VARRDSEEDAAEGLSHNPFRDALEQLKGREQSSPEEGVGRVASPAGPAAPAGEDTKADGGHFQPSPVDEIAQFREAVAGVNPLSSGGGAARLRSNRPPAGGRGLKDHRLEQVARSMVDLGPAQAARQGLGRDLVSRLERGEFPVQSNLDLHGMVLEDAIDAVRIFIARCRAARERCALVVTGKGRGSDGGRGVLCEEIPRWLSAVGVDLGVDAYSSALRRDGGDGALYLLLRTR
jgi:DNA-nicking Smr family endonuclease